MFESVKSVATKDLPSYNACLAQYVSVREVAFKLTDGSLPYYSLAEAVCSDAPRTVVGKLTQLEAKLTHFQVFLVERCPFK